MTFKDLFPNSSPPLLQLGEQIRQLILSSSPKIEEDFYGGAKIKMASYSIGRKDNVIAVLGLSADHCKLFLHHCDKIDSKGIKLQGKGKHAKHVKLFTQVDFDEAVYKDVISQVVEIVLTKV